LARAVYHDKRRDIQPSVCRIAAEAGVPDTRELSANGMRLAAAGGYVKQWQFRSQAEMISLHFGLACATVLSKTTLAFA
jgi:hypothetical protein